MSDIRNEKDALFSQEFYQWGTEQNWWSNPIYMEVAWQAWQAAGNDTDRDKALKGLIRRAIALIERAQDCDIGSKFDASASDFVAEAETILGEK